MHYNTNVNVLIIHLYRYKMKVEKYKTQCCNAEWYTKGRANFRCKKCDSDVTIEVMLLYNLIES